MNSADRNSIARYRFVMKAHANLAAVLALSQNGTQGAVTAPGTAREKGKVKLATFDATPFRMTGLVTGTIQLTVTQNPAWRERTPWTRRPTRSRARETA
jgi:ABC-type sugar transport system substrate-binding protein